MLKNIRAGRVDEHRIDSLMISRREFLGAGMVATAGALVGTGCQSTSPKSHQAGKVPPGNGRILDTHTHFYNPARPQGVPWPSPDDPLLYRPVLPPEYESLARPLGIVGTVVVEASAWEQDNAWVLELSNRFPFLIGLVGHLKPGRPGFAEMLARDGADPRFRGIRIGTWDGPARADEKLFLRDCHLLSQRGLAADLLVGPDRLPLVADLAAKVPDLRIVIDHCSNVPINGGPPNPNWIRDIVAVARHPHVFMKFSGYVEGSGRTDGTAPREVEFYRPTFDVLWDAFGPSRLVFGSNWPVSARFASLATVVGIARDYLAVKGSAEKVFWSNAHRAYRLGQA